MSINALRSVQGDVSRHPRRDTLPIFGLLEVSNHVVYFV